MAKGEPAEMSIGIADSIVTARSVGVLKAPMANVERPEGRATELRWEQPEKAERRISVTDGGMTIDLSAVHPENAS